MNNIEILKDYIEALRKSKPFKYTNEQKAQAIENLIQENKELKKDKLELINKNHVVHLKDVEKELIEMRKEIDIKNAEIECLNVIHESYKEMVKENNFISKDKIKELRDIDNIDLLQTKLKQLLEEGYLEGRKIESKKANEFIKENCIPKSKIKELLEHYKNTGYNELEEVLQELLEEGE